MTIEELNKIIQEELKAYLNEEQTDEAYHEDGDDDIEVTTDEPEEGDENEALDTLKQIYNMLKPIAEPEDEEPEVDLDDEEADDEEGEEEEIDEAVGYANYTADQVSKVKADADDVNKGLNESTLRMQKLAGLITESDIKKKLSLNENVSPEALIKVYQDEIKAAKENEQDDEIPAYRKGIEMLKKGKNPKEVNDKVQGLIIKLTGERGDPTVFLDKARKLSI